jgi:hypothetical protein
MSAARHESVRVTLADGTQLHLLADLNALCEFEVSVSALGLDPVREMERLEKSDRATLTALRAMIWACAVDRAPGLTVRQVGEMLAANPAALSGAVFEALRRAAPPAAADPGGSPSGNQPPPSA